MIISAPAALNPKTGADYTRFYVLIYVLKSRGTRWISLELSEQSLGVPEGPKPLAINDLWTSMDLPGTQQNK
jgi:hypothetical protein